MSIYFPVDVNFYDSPEFFEVNMSARGLWVTCGTWCKRHLTDGVIPAKIVRHLGGTVRQIKTLIKNTVWAESEQNGTKVYIFCDWFEHNLSREEVEERRRKWRESKQRSRAKNRPEQRKPAKPQSGPPQDVHHNVHDDVPRVREEVIEEDKRGGGQVPADPPPNHPPNPAAARCANHAHIPPNGYVPACHACRTERERAEALVVELENREAERRKASIAACPHCDDRGMAQTEDTNGNSAPNRAGGGTRTPHAPAAGSAPNDRGVRATCGIVKTVILGSCMPIPCRPSGTLRRR